MDGENKKNGFSDVDDVELYTLAQTFSETQLTKINNFLRAILEDMPLSCEPTEPCLSHHAKKSRASNKQTPSL